MGFLSLTLQYQKAQVTAIVKTIMQQKKKLQNSQNSIHTPVRARAPVESCLWLSCQSPFSIIRLRVYAQKPANKIVSMTLMTGVKKTIGFSEIKFVATFTKTIPVRILFLKHTRMHVQINNMTPMVMARAQFCIITPIRHKAPIKPSEEKIITIIIPLGASLIRKMQSKLTTIESTVQTTMGAICLLRSKVVSVVQGVTYRWQSDLVAMKQPPMPIKAAVMSAKIATHAGLLSFLSLTGQERHSWQVELYLSRYYSQLGRVFCCMDFVIKSYKNYCISCNRMGQNVVKEVW